MKEVCFEVNRFPKVRRNTLLLIAGLVWLFAGGNILRIGVSELAASWRWPAAALLAAALIFALFFKFVFYKMVNRHCCRIRELTEEKIPVYQFFDRKSYVIMACMITFGILLRSSHLLPPLWIGVFYTGLGTSLVGAGIFFLIRYCRGFAAAEALCE